MQKNNHYIEGRLYHILLIIGIILSFFNSFLNASDLITRQISIPIEVAECNQPIKPEFEICNINVFDALENEWSVNVVIFDESENTIFQEDVPGVFLANGSESSPSCVTLTTENFFNPIESGLYTIAVDVNYIYDINTENDDLIQEFFVQCALGAIHGQKFHDINGNGIADSNEVGVNGVTIKLFDQSGLVDSQKTHSMDLDGDNMIDPIYETGLFWFDSLTPGTYTISEVVPQGWLQTYPANQGVHILELGFGEIIEGVLFGNFAELWDFGDLPEPLDSSKTCAFGQCYPTKFPLGASHVANGPMLGNFRDTELDGLPTYTADGDDTTGVDDEDGVKFITFKDGDIGEVEVTVSGAPKDFPAYLSAWIDFDGDGFLAATEKIFTTVIPAPNVYNLTFNVPRDVARGGAARFRISTEPNSVDLPFGPAVDGEVEDYVAFGLDYGDANENVMPIDPQFPQGYPVKTTSNGARHVIVPTMRLGDEPMDNEQDGIPSFYSNGDDNDDKEDEYGIAYGDEFIPVFSGPDPDKPSRTLTIYGMEPGTEVSITPLATLGGLLNLWIDWNRDGDWKDDGEQIFDDVPILSGPNYTTLSFTVPVDAVDGYTYARYRYSTQIGLEYYGGAPNGEVEDHLLMIDSELTAVELGESSNLPDEYRLDQNYPNPFNPVTRINYSLPKGKAKYNVSIKIYDVLGRLVNVLLNETKAPGNYNVEFDASSLTSGIYYYRITADQFSMTRKMTLMK